MDNADNNEYIFSPREMYYGSIVTGKREPEIWGFPPELDPDGDGIVKGIDSGLIYNKVGPQGERSYTPLIENVIAIFKMVIIIMAITTGAVGAWYGTFGCIGEYIQTSWIWVSQTVIFCVILVNIWIVNAESPDAFHEATWTGWSIVGAFLTWVLLNIVAKIGDTWLFFDSPFWPGPMTYWGAVMFLGVVIYTIDLHRNYWKETRAVAWRDYADKRVQQYTTLESILAATFLAVTFWRFGTEWYTAKKKEGAKFSFKDFFLGFNRKDKNIIKDQRLPFSATGGRCKENIQKELKKEIKEGIKNSWWYKIRKNW